MLSHNGPVLVDFDETLYLRNSTEDFIDCASPAPLALLALRALDVVKPWRWTGTDTRDVWRVQTISLLFPWTHWLWRRRVGSLARAYANQLLVSALRCLSSPPVIVTLGFTQVVAPLIDAMGLGHVHVVGTRLHTFSDRRSGKLTLAAAALGSETVRRALVLTDSPADLPLLRACTRPLRTVWPGATFRRALTDAYVPGQYITQVKHYGGRYISRGILQEDLVLWLLCSIGFAPIPILHGLGIVFLLLSFWSVYEQGYVDNDAVSARYEDRTEATAAAATTSTARIQPWIWAVGSGLVAVTLLRWPGAPAVRDYAAWSIVLVLTSVGFRLYSRFDKSTRVWPYLGLQLARSAAFAVVTPIGPAGAAAIAANVFAKWVPYFLYRRTEQAWANEGTMAVRLHFYVILLLLLAVAHEPRVIWSGTSAALLAWCAFRARHELKAIFVAARRIDHA